MDVLQRLEPVFRDVFDEPDLKIHRGLTADDVEAWDSLSHIGLLAAVEKEFGIKFSLAEVRNLKDVGELADLVARKSA